ncbi:hypothetical protein [Exiguobacterium indicum]|uniref:hypothetical protein n=1 Tax=Exiguobacterium indicum TaxID=296995 RepID=UPI000AAFA594|nr:hypothetical protein [Exiguobacterium indicum]
MGIHKDQLIEQEDRGRNLDRCMICDGVLRTWEERNNALHDECLKEKIEND